MAMIIIVQSKEAGIRTLVMLDEQGGKTTCGACTVISLV